MPSDPETALIKCKTSKGDVWMEMHRAWSPLGYDKVVTLYEKGFYDHSYFHRVIPGFLVQFGISCTNDETLKEFGDTQINDDPHVFPPIPFKAGTISYAANGVNSRTSQLFISHGSIESLGEEHWETPIGNVVKGMHVLDSFLTYGDTPPFGTGPDPARIKSEGKKYVEENFPYLEYIQTCSVERWGGAVAAHAEVQAQFQALGDKYVRIEQAQNWEMLAFVGVVTMMISLCSFLGMKIVADDTQTNVLAKKNVD